MSTHTFGKTAVCAAMIILFSACGGGGSTQPGGNTGGVTPPPPPPPAQEKLSLGISIPASTIQGYQSFPMASLVAQVSATSTRADAVVTRVCKIDKNVTIPCDAAVVTLNLDLGPHTYKLIAISSLGAVDSIEVPTVVLPATITCRKIVAPTVNGEYVPQGTYIIADNGEGTVKDSTKVNADGTCSLNTRYAATSQARIILRGDASTNWWVDLVPSSSFSNLAVVMSPRSLALPSSGASGPINLTGVCTDVPTPSVGSYYWCSIENGGLTVPVGSFVNKTVCAAMQSVSVDGSNEMITSADSVNFFNRLKPGDQKYGFTRYKPCSEAEVLQNGGVLVRLKMGAGVNAGGTTKGNYGDHVRSIVALADHESFNRLSTVEHEAGEHAYFNVGHTCVWEGVMESSCPGSHPDTLSDADVRHSLLKDRTRELERVYNTRNSLGGSINGAMFEKFGAGSLKKVNHFDLNGKIVP